MARNKRPVEDKPIAESSDSEELNDSDQETDSDSGSLIPNNHLQHSDPVPKPDSDSESDSDSVRPSNFAIKPIESKQQPLKSAKRASEADAELGLKELKKLKGEDDNVKKGSVIQRLFSEEDEIALLEGAFEFQSKKGIDAYSEISKFHEFIKKNIHFDATPNQLKEKIRRLKGKFNALVKKSGEDPVISKSHDFKIFNLSKKLWGSNAEKPKKTVKTSREVGGNEGGGITLALASKGERNLKKVVNGGGTKKKESGQGKQNDDSEGDDAEEEEDHMVVDEKGVAEEDFSAKYPLCVGGLMEAEGLSEKSKGFWVQKLGLIGKEKLEHYEAKLENIKWAELELFIQKREVINEKLRLLRDASKTSQ